MSILEVENLNKFYGKKHVLKDVTLKADTGEVIGLYGPNGSGKTTLLKLILGLLKPSSGNIRIDGEDISIKSKEVVSFLPDKNILPNWMRVRDAKDFYKDFFKGFNEGKFLELISFFKIEEGSKIKELSKGEVERVLLSLCLARKAKIYLLDEPLSGIDPSTRDEIIKSIIKNYQENSLMIISTHLIREIENVADRTIFISQGEIILDERTEDLREKNKKSIEDLFKDIFSVERREIYA